MECDSPLFLQASLAQIGELTSWSCVADALGFPAGKHTVRGPAPDSLDERVEDGAAFVGIGFPREQPVLMHMASSP